MQIYPAFWKFTQFITVHFKLCEYGRNINETPILRINVAEFL